MTLVRIDTAACARDGLCVLSCPIGCLTTDDQGYPVGIPDIACIQCGHCVAICPAGAIENASLANDEFTPSQASGIGSEAMTALLKSRRSVREYRKKPLTDEELATLIEVGRYAPTASNTQLLTWVSVEDEAARKGVVEASMEWLAGMAERAHLQDLIKLYEKGNDVILRNAPNLLIACAPADYPWGAVDCSIAMTYVEIQAAAMGLGACWAGLVLAAMATNPDMGRALGIPADQKACAALMLGHPLTPYKMIPPRNPARVIRV